MILAANDLGNSDHAFIVGASILRTTDAWWGNCLSAWPKINSHSKIFRYGWSIFCLPHWPKLSDFFDLCLHWVSKVRVCKCPLFFHFIKFSTRSYLKLKGIKCETYTQTQFILVNFWTPRFRISNFNENWLLSSKNFFNVDYWSLSKVCEKMSYKMFK